MGMRIEAMSKFNIKESKAWKDSIGAWQKVWGNYLNNLSTYWRNMSRSDQEELITNFSCILAVGGTTLAWYPIYPLFPSILKVIAVPLSLVLAYFFGRNIASKIIIDRCGKYLNDQ